MTNLFDLLADPRFSTAAIAKATGVPAETIRTWFKRRILGFEREGMGVDVERVGLGRSYSGYAALTIAIMGQLTAGGMTADDARRAALYFFASDDEREPGYIYEHGETLMVIAKDDLAGLTVQIVNAGGNGYGDGKAFTWDQLFALSNHRSKRIEILRMTELWQGVTMALGIRAELEEVWNKKSPG